MLNQEQLDNLLEWFYKVREPHFFRQQRNPYRVWISEVVLQQTRIQAAMGPLKRFLDEFPDIASLAKATKEDVVFAFRGLGYYSRARNLRKGAIYIEKHYSGVIPQKYQDLLLIPSIGPYTAAAISSICFGNKHPVCDGNVKRILARTERWREPIKNKKIEEKSYKLLNRLFKKMEHNPGDTNEAIMELGQKICIKSTPKCDFCPIAPGCNAYNKQQVQDYPVQAAKKEKIEVKWHLYLIADGNNILMQNWDDFYFLKGQIAFPSLLEFVHNKTCMSSWRTDEKFKEWQHPGQIQLTFPVVKHGITKHKIEIHSYFMRDAEFPDKDNFIWVPEKNVSARLVSSALIKVWQKYLDEKNS